MEQKENRFYSFGDASKCRCVYIRVGRCKQCDFCKECELYVETPEFYDIDFLQELYA